MMTNDIAAMRIARELTASEADIDQAIMRSAHLMATMLECRRETNSDVATGHVAVMRLTKTLAALVDARSEIVRTHGELRKVGEERGDFMTGPCLSINQLGEREAAIAA